MAKSLQQANFTRKELEDYANTAGSCVHKINSNLHFALGSYCLKDFKNKLKDQIIKQKIGIYNDKLDGIVLDVKNIKVLGTIFPLRADDPLIHININADCYIFRPEIGVDLNGVIKHIGNHHIGVVIYRVFNSNVRLGKAIKKNDFEIDQKIQFTIGKFDVKNVYPYIEGTLTNDTLINDILTEESVDKNESLADSGIEEKYDINIIKKEKLSPTKIDVEENSKSKNRKSKRKQNNEADETISNKITKKQKKADKETIIITSPPVKIKKEKLDAVEDDI